MIGRTTMMRLARAVALAITTGATAAAQQPAPGPAPTQSAARREPSGSSISAHLHVGRLSQTASESFTAVLGRASGQVFGAGAELTLADGFFVRGDISHFAGDGERIHAADGRIVPVGIPLSLSLTPIEFSGGYRLHAYTLGRRGRVQLVPYIGAGAGVVLFHEETDDEHPEESASERFASYHVLIGLDVPLGRRVAIGAELTRRWVPDALGAGGVSEVLGESDLGGSTVRVRFRVNF